MTEKKNQESLILANRFNLRKEKKNLILRT